MNDVEYSMEFNFNVLNSITIDFLYRFFFILYILPHEQGLVVGFSLPEFALLDRISSVSVLCLSPLECFSCL